MDLTGVDAIVAAGIADGVSPGACYAVGIVGCDPVLRAMGAHTYELDSKRVDLDTIWDLASASKVVSTTSAAMLLYDDGLLDLDRPVAECIPEFGQRGKHTITPRNLLLHNAGLAPFNRYFQRYSTPEEVFAALWREELAYPVGTDTVYSDLGFIVLGRLLEVLSGISLDRFLSERLWESLGMVDTLYSPDTLRRARCAPTEPVETWRAALRKLRGSETAGHWIVGEVHDPAAMLLGGVAGHAGLFSTVDDLAKFMQAILDGGHGLINPTTVKLFTTRVSEKSSRALGWDTPSPGSSAGSRFGPRSFGHTGFTGTSIWADPEAGVYAILLTNRVHPTAENMKIKDLRIAFQDAAFDAAQR